MNSSVPTIGTTVFSLMAKRGHATVWEDDPGGGWLWVASSFGMG